MDDKELQIFLKQQEAEDKKLKEMMKQMGLDDADMECQGYGDPELDALEKEMMSKSKFIQLVIFY